MAEFDASSRYKLVETATQNPGFDLLTRSTVGPFVDTGLTLNKFDPAFAEANSARVYISVDTIREMAEGAGLFEPLRAELEAAEDRGFAYGYAAAEKENLRGAVLDLHDRLGRVLDRYDDAAAASAVEGTGDGDGEEPLVLVLSRDEAREYAGDSDDGAHEPDAGADEAGRQGDGARSDERSNRVPASASHVNPFRI